MALLQERVVSKEAAIKLRKMGHDAWCDCYYHTDNDEPDDYEMGNNQVQNSTFEDYHERCAAPYVSQALLWLMQFKGIAVDVRTYPANNESGFEYSVKLKFGEYDFVSGTDIDYQEALRRAIDSLLLGTCIDDPSKNFMFIQKDK